MESKFIRGLLAGSVTTFILGTTIFGSYTFALYKQAEPGFKIIDETKNYTENERKEITSALIKLSGIADFLGVDRASSLFTGSAAVVLGKNSPLLAKFHFIRAIEMASKVAVKSGQFDPLLEMRFNYSLFLADIGSKKEAKEYLSETLRIAEKNFPQSHWIENLKRAQNFLDKNS